MRCASHPARRRVPAARTAAKMKLILSIVLVGILLQCRVASDEHLELVGAGDPLLEKKHLHTSLKATHSHSQTHHSDQDGIDKKESNVDNNGETEGDFDEGGLLPTPDKLQDLQIIEEPKDGSTSSSKPAMLTCSAINALSMHFRCNGQIEKKVRTMDFVDPMTGIRQIDVQLEVPSSRLEKLLSADGDKAAAGYTCICYAWSSKGKAESRKAVVKLSPDGGWSPWGQWSDCSSRCGRGSQTRTRSCTNPPPRNGGADCKGEYAEKKECHVQCNVNPPVDGRWASWSAWSQCGSDCKQHRTRTCTNPPPSRGGRHCSGKDQMSTNCTGGHCMPPAFTPPIGKVSHDQSYFADQEPHSPTEQAALGGLQSIAFVIGMALAAIILGATFLIALRFWPRINKREQSMYSVPVTGVNITMPPDLTQTLTSDPRLLSEYLTERKLDPGITIPLLQQLYAPNMSVPPGSPLSQCRNNGTVGSGVGGVTGQQNRSRTPSSTGKPPRSDSPHSTLANGHFQQRTTESEGTPGSDYDIYDTISMSARASLASNTINRHVEADWIAWETIGPQGGRINLPHLGVSMTIPPGAVKKGKHEMFLAVLRDDRDRPNLSEEETLLSPVVQIGPSNVHLNRAVIVSFEHCAQVPAENWLISVFSSQAGSGSISRRSCDGGATLTGGDGSGDDTVISGSGGNGGVSSWKRLVLLGQENLNTPLYCQMDSKSCHIQTERLARYALVGESRDRCFATKSLTLAAFVSRPHSDYSIRIYCVEDTRAALKAVLAAEDGIMLETPKSFLMHDGGANLCLTLEDLSSGWTFKPGANYQEIPFTHVWSSRQSQLHCSFILQQQSQSQQQHKIINNCTTSPDSSHSSLRCKITVYQRGNQSHRQILSIEHSPGTCAANILNNLLDLNNPSSQQTLQVVGLSSTLSQSTPSSPIYRNITELNHQHNLSNANSSTTGGMNPQLITKSLDLRGGGTVSVSVIPVEGFRLSQEARKQLCAYLDPPQNNGKDWRGLAAELGMDRYTNYFATKSSPTSYVLDLWEARHREANAQANLVNILRIMGRHDVATACEKLFGSWV